MERGRIIAPFFAMFEEMAITNNLQNDTWPRKMLQFVQDWLALLEKMANPRELELKEFLIGLHMVSWLARPSYLGAHSPQFSLAARLQFNQCAFHWQAD